MTEMNKPTIQPMERRVRELVLLNPWTSTTHIYRLDSTGLHLLRKLGPVSVGPVDRKVPLQ